MLFTYASGYFARQIAIDPFPRLSEIFGLINERSRDRPSCENPRRCTRCLHQKWKARCTKLFPRPAIREMFFVTFVQFAVPSFVNHTWPSFVPAQISPFCLWRRRNRKNYFAIKLSKVIPNNSARWFYPGVSFVERSGLLTVQLCPAFVVFQITWHP